MKVILTLCAAALITLTQEAIVFHPGMQIDELPSTYDEVADAYIAMEENAITRGTAAVGQFLNQEFEALREEFSAETSEVLPEDLLEQTFAAISIHPIGEKLSERIMPLAGMTVYMASYEWGDAVLNVTVYFDTSSQIIGLNVVPDEPLPLDPAQGYESEAAFQLPFDGLWYTAWGGDDRIHNYHVDAPPQRHAYDFVIWQNGSTFSGDGTNNEDYYAYGQPVLAPADGRVIAVVDDLPDNQPQVETNEQHPAGNHVVIQVGESEFVFLAHLQPGSVVVEPGQAVETGQQVGLVGNSGNSSEPHLHIHMQDQSEMFELDENGQAAAFTDAIGLPLRFAAYLENGELTENDQPEGGVFVQNNSRDN